MPWLSSEQVPVITLHHTTAQPTTPHQIHALPGSRPCQRSSRGNVVGGLVRHHAGSTKEGQPDAGHHHHLCLLGTRQRHMLGNSRFTSVQKRSSSRVSRTESLGKHCWLVWNSFEIVDDYLNYTWFDCITSALKLTCEKGNVKSQQRENHVGEMFFESVDPLQLNNGDINTIHKYSILYKILTN